MGRKRCEVATDAAQDHAMQFAASGPRLFTAPLSLRLRVLPDV
jgi:hypothetical protein